MPEENIEYRVLSIKAGFTLIELLVVVSLIGLLATLVFANLNAARERGRDAQRKADLRNVQTALRLYFNDNTGYPTSDGSYQIVGCGSKASRTVCTSGSLTGWGVPWTTYEGQTYMNLIPKDPVSAQSYRYTFVDSDNYTLAACLENKSDTQGVADTSWGTACPSGYVYTVKP